MRKRDWLMAAALVPYSIVMLPIATVGAVGMIAWGMWRPRRSARLCAISPKGVNAVQKGPIRTLTATKI